MSVDPFDLRPSPRLIFGAGEIDRLGEVVADLGGRRVLVVSDPGIVEAGHTARGLRSLEAASIPAVLFDGVEENPTTAHVRRGVELARSEGIDLIVGLGGGSSLDCAKGINFLLSCGGEMRDYQGVGKATGPMLPMVAVPTTAGTGSEMQSFALISDEATHRKMACGDRRAACRAAILDPEVTVSQPPGVTAATGIDALAHAVETFVTRSRNTLSRRFSLEAWKLIDRHIETVLSHPSDVEARGAMQLGAALAGYAIEHSMLGAAHAAANPLTATYSIVHGGAVGVMLPHVVRLNAAVAADDYLVLARQARRVRGTDLPALIARLQEIMTLSGLPTSLSGWGVDPDRLRELASEAATQWTAGFNPRPVTGEDFLALYRAAY